MFLGFNVAKDHLPAGNTANPLAEQRAREALAMATDVEGISRSVMRGLTKPIATIVAPEIQGYDPVQAEPRAEFDPARAKQMLAEAGYPDGFQIGLDCPSDRFVNAERVCQAIASMWAKVGVKVALSTMRYAAFSKRYAAQESDTFLMGWANTPQLGRVLDPEQRPAHEDQSFRQLGMPEASATRSWTRWWNRHGWRWRRRSASACLPPRSRSSAAPST